jgi:hypothetical protein
MLQQVVLQTTVPMTLDIDAVDPDELIVIKSISGLDPADVTLFTGDFARDGGYYQGRRSGRRNPVFNLKLNPDYANDIEVSDIREMLYTMFFEPTPGQDGLQVVLKDDRKPDRYFIGFTEKLPSDIFSRDTTAQVSMLCVDPFLKSVEEVSVDDAGLVSFNIDYEGSARTGLELTMTANGADVITIDINGVEMELNASFNASDVIYLNTVIGSRAIRQNGSDIMASLVSGPQWLQLEKGSNAVVVSGAAVTNYTYRAAWWGI